MPVESKQNPKEKTIKPIIHTLSLRSASSLRKGKLPQSNMNAITPALQRSAFCVYPAPLSTLGRTRKQQEKKKRKKNTNKNSQTHTSNRAFETKYNTIENKPRQYHNHDATYFVSTGNGSRQKGDLLYVRFCYFRAKPRVRLLLHQNSR